MKCKGGREKIRNTRGVGERLDGLAVSRTPLTGNICFYLLPSRGEQDLTLLYILCKHNRDSICILLCTVNLYANHISNTCHCIRLLNSVLCHSGP